MPLRLTGIRLLLLRLVLFLIDLLKEIYQETQKVNTFLHSLIEHPVLIKYLPGIIQYIYTLKKKKIGRKKCSIFLAPMGFVPTISISTHKRNTKVQNYIFFALRSIFNQKGA